MEYDLEKIGKLIKDIEKYEEELRSYKITNVQDLKDSKNFNAASMVVFAILNRVIDLSNDLLLAEKVGAPNSYQDIMPMLAKANIINKDQAEKLNNLIRKRNVLAHFYEDMNENELFRTIKELPEISQFVKSVKKRIKNSSLSS